MGTNLKIVAEKDTESDREREREIEKKIKTQNIF